MKTKSSTIQRRPEMGAAARSTSGNRVQSRLDLSAGIHDWWYRGIGNVVAATWDQFDLHSATPTWTIPREQMKVRDRDRDHRVPLGPTITAELLTWQRVTKEQRVVFPSPSGKRPFVGREAIEQFYSEVLNLDGRHSPHSWSTAFGTLCRELGDLARDVVELALDHVSDGKVIRAYNRALRFEQRVRLRGLLWRLRDAATLVASRRHPGVLAPARRVVIVRGAQ
jgi:integrase